jgi:hypothetical protein
MPIHNMNYEAGIFFTKQVGYVDDVDIRMWHNALNKYAKIGDTPVMAIIDMREIDRLCPTSTKVLSGALALPNVLGIAIVTSDVMCSRNARVFGTLNEQKGVRIFATTDDAYTFAQSRISPSVGYAGTVFAFQVSYIY